MNANDAREKVQARIAQNRLATSVVAGPSGIVPLTQLSADRSSFLLIGPPGVGKSVGASTFGGDDYGRILYMLIEHGQEGGAGGATPLKFLGATTGVQEADIDVLPVTSWRHAQLQYKWVCDHVRELFEERKIRVLIVDGITEVSAMIETELGAINPAQLGVDHASQRALVNDLVRDIDGRAGRQMEMADFGRILRLMRGFIAKLKFLPFRVVATALEGDMYGDTRQGENSQPIGIGPDLPGRKIVSRVCGQFDFVFHCERKLNKDTRRVDYLWLTQNDPRLRPGTAFAKSRAGFALEPLVPSCGREVLRALGFKPEPLDAPLPAPPSPGEVRATLGDGA